MIKKSFAYKLALGLVLTGLILPIKAPVASGEARLCCKIFCSHKIPAMKAHGHGDMKNCGESGAAHVQCCQDRCASVMGVKRFPTIAVAKILPSAPSVKSIAFPCAADCAAAGLLPRTSSTSDRLASGHVRAGKTPPLFLLQSVFRL